MLLQYTPRGRVTSGGILSPEVSLGVISPEWCLLTSLLYCSVACVAAHRQWSRLTQSSVCHASCFYSPRCVYNYVVAAMSPNFGAASINPLECRDTSNDTNLVHWPLMGGLLHLVQ